MPSTNEKARRAGARRASHATEAQCKVVGRFSITFALSTSSAASMRASFGWSARGGSSSKIKHTNGIVSPIVVVQDFGIRIKEVELGGTTFSSVIRKSRMMIVGTITKSCSSSAPENSNKNRLPSTIGRASILFARNVCGAEEANKTENDASPSSHPSIATAAVVSAETSRLAHPSFAAAARWLLSPRTIPFPADPSWRTSTSHVTCLGTPLLRIK